MREWNINVLAGVNGAGKSSVAGKFLIQRGMDYFDPDQATRLIQQANPGISQADANGAAWLEGKRLLEQAIASKIDFAFETTLGGKTITGLLEAAANAGGKVHVWYVGLKRAELHVKRVRSRVAAGGHEIPEERIIQRYTQSRLNLIRLLPRLAELRVFDNSEEADPKTGRVPKPKLLLHTVGGKVVKVAELAKIAEWAKAIVVEALKLQS